jgi:hypothetical protein
MTDEMYPWVVDVCVRPRHAGDMATLVRLVPIAYRHPLDPPSTDMYPRAILPAPTGADGIPHAAHPGPGARILWSMAEPQSITSGLLSVIAGSGHTWRATAASAARILRRHRDILEAMPVRGTVSLTADGHPIRRLLGELKWLR